MTESWPPLHEFFSPDIKLCVDVSIEENRY